MKNNNKIIIFALAGGLSVLTATASVMVDFTLSLDTATNPSANYNNFHEAEGGTHDVFTVGFQVQIHSIDGTTVNVPAVAAFCSELEESVSTIRYDNTFEATSLSYLAGGQAGVEGTASSAIPVGGIGQQRAAYVNYFFDAYYISDVLSGWAYTEDDPKSHAFQLALWEITHDEGLSLATGEISIGLQDDGGTDVTTRNNGILRAQEMLDDVYLNLASISDTYISTNFSIWALANVGVSGEAGLQDVVLAIAKDSPTDAVLEPFLPAPAIPEPATHALMGLFGMVYWVGRRCHS